MSTRDVGTFQMLWNCSSCGTEKLLGTDHRYCPNCSAPQAAAERYFPPEGQEIAVKDHVFHGVDWQCPGCDTPNSAAASFCGSCGAPRESDAREVDRKSAEAPPEPPKKKSKGCALFGCGGLLLIGIIAAIVVAVGFLWKKPVDLTVTGHQWTRSIEIERYDAVRESEWCSAMPSAAYEVSRTSEVKETKQVPDGETCTTKNVDQGDGTFKKVEECKPKYRDEPVYADKCSYKIDRWATARSVDAAGTGLDPAPTWPSVGSLNSGSSRGSEREGARRESYVVTYQDDEGDSHDCDYSQARWQGVADGSRWQAKAGVLFGFDCDSLSPAQ